MKFNAHKLGLAAATGYLVTALINTAFVIIVGGGSIDLTAQLSGVMGSLLLLHLVSGYTFGYILASAYNKLT